MRDSQSKHDYYRQRLQQFDDEVTSNETFRANYTDWLANETPVAMVSATLEIRDRPVATLNSYALELVWTRAGYTVEHVRLAYLQENHPPKIGTDDV
jgi:hypothetical protein